MAHIVSRQPWGVIDVDVARGRVFFQQDWHYTWVLFAPSVHPWTLAERRNFHNTVDRQVWGTWSNRVRLQVTGANDFSHRFARAGVGLNFDIRWVTSVAHWSVTVRKMPPGSGRTTYRSNVTFATRRIELDSADLAAGGAANDAGASTPRFRSPPHEFGHTLSLPDEYGTGSPDLADSGSIMNIGREIRPRHLALIVTELNKMMPGVTFVAPLVVP
jgi:hypothetical protein